MSWIYLASVYIWMDERHNNVHFAKCECVLETLEINHDCERGLVIWQCPRQTVMPHDPMTRLSVHTHKRQR